MGSLKSVYKYLFFLILCATTAAATNAQSGSFEDLVYRSDSLNITYPREKIFIHHDKPYYRLRDTIWLKGYRFMGPANIPDDSSRLVYIELINVQNEVVKRISTPCKMGLFAANISLPDKLVVQGEYRLRAYTRYSMNFGEPLFFESRFAIIDPSSEEWKTRVQELRFDGKRLVAAIGVSAQNSQLSGRALTIKLRSKNKLLFRTKAITDETGKIYIDTLITDNGHQSFQLEIADGNTTKLQLPVTNQKSLVDLQFLPEGGTFIAGKQQRLGFKAINAFGKGVDVKGVIKDAEGNEITRFSSIHKGMGIAAFTPVVNETYTAFLENGLTFKLPLPQSSGIMLQVITDAAADSLQLKIAASPDIQKKLIYFVARTGGVSAARGRVPLTAAGYELKISKAELLPGITVFTLYDENLVPVNGRAVFIPPTNELKLTLTANKAEYAKKDSVSLMLQVQDKKGKNIAGSFSMAVLDTSQVKVFPNGENLASYMLLSADLKGEIEEPYYYFNQPDPDALEALLLTQGWVSYTSIPATPALYFEKDFMVSGKVTNIFDKALDGTKVTLFAKVGKHKAFFSDTVTNASGEFTFTHLPLYETDSVSMLLQALNRKGKSFNVGISLKEPIYPAVTSDPGLYSNGSILTDTLARDYITRHEKIRTQLVKDGIMLEEVVLKSKSRIPGSKNLNEDGGADQVINEEVLNKTPKETLLTILEKQAKGFRAGILPKSNYPAYMINSNIVRLIIDGVDVHFFYRPSSGLATDYLHFITSYLNSLNGEDIKGIEIMNSGYNTPYRSTYLTLEEQASSGPTTIDYSFIEVTTYSGLGPFLKKTPGMYLFKPVYPVLSKQFYSPKYTSPEQKTVLPDLRNTIYWDQDIVTDSGGKAIVSFYTSESNGSYVIIIQGTDLNGNFGILYQPLHINVTDRTRF